MALLPLAANSALAVIPYTPVAATGVPVVGHGVMPPPMVYGKEYSHDFDFSTIGPVLDPEQVIAWDGVGGTADGLDYSDFPRPLWDDEDEVDALANTRDALFDEVTRDEAHLIFSHDDRVAGYGPFGLMGIPVPSAGPIPISNGNLIGGAGELTVEEAGVFALPSTQYTWAKQPEINGMPLPDDVDGVEVWGPEPREIGDPGFPLIGDADKYSLDIDVDSGVSVWNVSGTPYIPHATIVTAVESLLGFVPPSAFSFYDDQQGHNAINLDALMVSDIFPEDEHFGNEFAVAEAPGVAPGVVIEPPLDQNGEPFEPFGPDGEHRDDSIIFSIRQIVNPDPADPDGYYATGSELFVLDAFGGASFLKHGGHVWDHIYTLGALRYFDEQHETEGVLDINAIEAIGEDLFVPLPGDFNADGTVDAADYTVFRDFEGTGHPLAGNGDETGPSMGVVDDADYFLWRTHFGSTAPTMAPGVAPSSAPVPEPTAAALLMLAAVGVLVKRRG